jgi:KaiC/GvpD/RAD55 family RecA-like ATPase
MNRSQAAYLRLPTGIDGLDLLLDGGLRYPASGSIFLVILGGPGSGKTHFALELAVRTLARERDPGACHVFYSLDQSPSELHAKLREDFDFYGMAPDWSRVLGSIENDEHSAQIHAFTPPPPAAPRHLVLAHLREPPREIVTRSGALFERLDGDIAALTRRAESIGTGLRPRLIAIDNISVNAFDDGAQARAALHSIRRSLAQRGLHGIFVIETPGGDGHDAAFTAAEYAADVILQLGYHEVAAQFKERSIEIAKARHQFYFRGTHHFSIVGRNEGELRGGRGRRPPGVHVYPSVPTLLSHLGYRGPPENAGSTVPFGVADLTIPAGSVSGLVGPPRRGRTAHALALRFLLAEPGTGILISLRERERELREFARRAVPEADRDRVHVMNFDPEYLSAGKFLKDVYDGIEELRSDGHVVRRAALWGIGHLKLAFPLLSESRMLLPWMSGFFKQQGIASLFVESANAVHPDGTISGDSAVPSSVEHLLFLVEKPDGATEIQLVRSLSAHSERHGRSIPVPGDCA